MESWQGVLIQLAIVTCHARKGLLSQKTDQVGDEIDIYILHHCRKIIPNTRGHYAKAGSNFSFQKSCAEIEF